MRLDRRAGVRPGRRQDRMQHGYRLRAARSFAAGQAMVSNRYPLSRWFLVSTSYPVSFAIGSAAQRSVPRSKAAAGSTAGRGAINAGASGVQAACPITLARARRAPPPLGLPRRRMVTAASVRPSGRPAHRATARQMQKAHAMLQSHALRRQVPAPADHEIPGPPAARRRNPTGWRRAASAAKSRHSARIAE